MHIAKISRSNMEKARLKIEGRFYYPQPTLYFYTMLCRGLLLQPRANKILWLFPIKMMTWGLGIWSTASIYIFRSARIVL